MVLQSLLIWCIRGWAWGARPPGARCVTRIFSVFYNRFVICRHHDPHDRNEEGGLRDIEEIHLARKRQCCILHLTTVMWCGVFVSLRWSASVAPHRKAKSSSMDISIVRPKFSSFKMTLFSNFILPTISQNKLSNTLIEALHFSLLPFLVSFRWSILHIYRAKLISVINFIEMIRKYIYNTSHLF